MAERVMRAAPRIDAGTEWYLLGDPPSGEELEATPVYEDPNDVPVMGPEARLWYHPLADTR